MMMVIMTGVRWRTNAHSSPPLPRLRYRLGAVDVAIDTDVTAEFFRVSSQEGTGAVLFSLGGKEDTSTPESIWQKVGVAFSSKIVG